MNQIEKNRMIKYNKQKILNCIEFANKTKIRYTNKEQYDLLAQKFIGLYNQHQKKMNIVLVGWNVCHLFSVVYFSFRYFHCFQKNTIHRYIVFVIKFVMMCMSVCLFHDHHSLIYSWPYYLYIFILVCVCVLVTLEVHWAHTFAWTLCIHICLIEQQSDPRKCRKIFSHVSYYATYKKNCHCAKLFNITYI